METIGQIFVGFLENLNKNVCFIGIEQGFSFTKVF